MLSAQESTGRRLTPKQERTLRALAATNPAEPLTEFGVWMVVHPDRVTGSFYAALACLVEHGYAVRTGRRGGYEWYITDAGRGALDAS